jgi:hypothetical protein
VSAAATLAPTFVAETAANTIADTANANRRSRAVSVEADDRDTAEGVILSTREARLWRSFARRGVAGSVGRRVVWASVITHAVLARSRATKASGSEVNKILLLEVYMRCPKY